MADAATISTGDLEQLDLQVRAALSSQDHAGLPILGFGEVSMALGWPAENPTVVCKRMPPATPAEIHEYRTLVDSYIASLRAVGVNVAPTEIRVLEDGDDRIGYLVQPHFARETLGEIVLANAEPDPEHPFLVAIAAAINTVTDRLSIDAQVTNWSWDGNHLTLLDVGTPFMWDPNGRLLLDLDSIMLMLPWPVRSIVLKDLRQVVDRWKDPRSVGVDVVANLIRLDLEQWIEPTIAALQTARPRDARIRREEGAASLAEDVKTFPRLKQLQRIERAWRTRVRRRDYGFLIQESTLDRSMK